jgi:zinc protease
MKQTIFELKNKMKVILVPSHKSPVVSVQMWVKTGSADEKKGEEGISHFIEHLVFKGTEKYKVGEIANIVEASGGELNAYTSFDQTVFYVTISKNYLDTAVDVVAQMMGHPTFDADETHSEREVVCEEIKMGMDSPGRSASQLMFKSVFKKHPYGIPVIGYEKNVRSWPVKKIQKYFNSRYVPSNMTLIISGDFDLKETKKDVTDIFSKFAPHKLVKSKRAKEPKQKAPTFSSLTKDIVETTLQMAWPAPNAKHKDIPALEVLAMILGQGETSRLYSKIRLENTLANTVSAYAYNPVDSGLFTISSKLTDQSMPDLFTAIFTELERVLKYGITWEELKKAVINISSEQFYSIETVDGIANKIGSEYFYLNDTKAYEKYLAKIQQLQPKDIQKVAQKYLDINKTNFSMMNKKPKSVQIASLKEGLKIWKQVKKGKVAAVEFKDKPIKMPKIKFSAPPKLGETSIEFYKTKKGTEILFKKITDTPTTSAKIIFGGGSRLETADQQGVTEMLTRIWPSATVTKTEAEYLRLIEESAAGLNSFGGKNTNGLSVDYMKPFEKTLLDLTAEVVTQPVLSQEIFTREMDVLKKQILSKQDNPSYLCGRQFLQMMFPDTVMSYEQSGTLETLNNINLKDVEKSFNKFRAVGNMQVAVVGDYDRSRWIEAVEKMESSFELKGRQLKTVSIAKLTENKQQFLMKDKEQSHVMIGWNGVSLTDPRRYILQIMQAVLSGQGGRLFIELRDKNSLAYSVSPIKMETLETGYFGGYIACSPDKVSKAVDMFKDEFNKLASTLISEEELDRAKKYLIGQNDIGLQRKSSYCNMIAFDHFYGNKIDDNLHVQKIYNAITREDIRNLAAELFSKNYVTSIVGRE